MKSKSSIYIIVVVVLVVIAIVVYVLAVKGKGANASSGTPGLVSTNTGSTSGVPTSSSTTANSIPTSAGAVATPGQQVVALLRNLSSIQLDDTIFTNPSFGLLQDLSVQLPEVTNQGRRNPFAPVGSDTPSPAAATNGAGVVFQIPGAGSGQ